MCVLQVNEVMKASCGILWFPLLNLEGYGFPTPT
jgi:hypothetical protein